MKNYFHILLCSFLVCFWHDANGAVSFEYHLLEGKEYISDFDWNKYNFTGRTFDSWTLRALQVDPMATKYYGISPYALWMGNPLRVIDPTGCEIDLSKMSEEEKKRYESQVAALRENSKLFNTIYTLLENSKKVYVIKFGQTFSIGADPVKGQFSANKDEGGAVTFLESEKNIATTVMSEEFFHAYQHDNKSNYGNGEFNIEFEAKTFNIMVGLEYGGFGEFPGMGDFQLKIVKGDYGNGEQIISPEAVVSEPFVKDFTNSANSYAKYNRENNYGNIYYKKNTTILPYSLQKVIINTYKKK